MLGFLKATGPIGERKRGREGGREGERERERGERKRENKKWAYEKYM